RRGTADMATSNTELANLVIKLQADTAELTDKIGRVDKRMRAFDQGLRKISKSVVGSLTAMFAADKIKDFTLATLKAAGDVEEMTSMFNAVFREQAGETRAWADSFAKDVGRFSYELQGFLTTLQDTFVPLGFARDKGAQLSKQLTELAV